MIKMKVGSDMNINEALDALQGLQKFGSILGLERIQELLRRLGDPQKSLKFVHVAGTNGKGSIVAFLSQILQEAGYQVGMYTSPGLMGFQDRIRVGGEDIADEALIRLTKRVLSAMEAMVSEGLSSPTEFEAVTALAFLYFLEKQCDVVVLEVGLGGRLDSTNVIDAPLVSVITPVDYDHMEILGNTLGEIAGEKAGILKTGTVLVLHPQREEADQVIHARARELDIPVHSVLPGQALHLSRTLEGQSFSLAGETFTLGILGDHQIANALTAMAAIRVLEEKGFTVSHEALKKGLANARWGGRFEVLSAEPAVLADGAHNPQGARVLAENLNNYFPGRQGIFIMGVLADKDYNAMIEAVLPFSKGFFTVTPKNNRALKAELLATAIQDRGKAAMAMASVGEALAEARRMAEPTDYICFFGSLYTMAEIRSLFLS